MLGPAALCQLAARVDAQYGGAATLPPDIHGRGIHDHLEGIYDATQRAAIVVHFTFTSIMGLGYRA